MTPKMTALLNSMKDGKRRYAGRGHRTMLALESRGLVKRHLSINPAWSDRWTITDAGEAA